MTLQAIKLLRKLKKAQMEEDGTLYINCKKKTAVAVKESGSKVIAVSLSRNWDGIDKTMTYLRNENFITKIDHNDHYELTHSGYHFAQTMVSSFLSFLLKSVIIPIAVAILTAALTTAFLVQQAPTP